MATQLEVNLVNFRYRAEITVKCDLGYAMVPRDLIPYCDRFGDWQPAPNDSWCQNITCPMPEPAGQYAIPNGNLRSQYIYSHTVQYTCNKTGYQLRRSFMIMNTQRSSCLGVSVSGRVSMVTSCMEEDRRLHWMWEGNHLVMSMDSGVRSAAAMGLPVGNRCYIFFNHLPHFLAQVTCFENSHPTAESMCTKFAQWNTPTKYIKCILIRCPLLPELPGMLASMVDGAEPVYGNRGRYSCLEGKNFGGGLNEVFTVCDITGNWAPPPDGFRCVEIVCKPPPHVEFATQTGLLWTYESKIKYTCGIGYWFERGLMSKETTCTAEAKWEPDPEKHFKCVAVRCPDPGPLANAKYFIAADDVAYDAVVQ
ncbi:unnamed protein product [Clavelina lepadiformis]|uniref:Sushi domain-containing protein n=1 Tax=Clavelina lepadiformis TaxID=159417 RepID=A0ABP0GQM9_CLALP